jgi:hypothetical protein
VESPEKDWDLDRLAEFALSTARTASGLEDQIASLKSQVTRLHYVRGEALFLAREQTKGKRGRWTEWRREKGLDKRADEYDLLLWEKAQDRGGWKAIAHLGLTEARIELGVTKANRVKSTSEDTPATDPPDTTNIDQTTNPTNTPAVMPDSAPGTAVEKPASVPVSKSVTKHGASLTTAQKALLLIVRRLEELEREVQERGPLDEGSLALIDQAEEILRRLGGLIARKEAA